MYLWLHSNSLLQLEMSELVWNDDYKKYILIPENSSNIKPRNVSNKIKIKAVTWENIIKILYF